MRAGQNLGRLKVEQPMFSYITTARVQSFTHPCLGGRYSNVDLEIERPLDFQWFSQERVCVCVCDSWIDEPLVFFQTTGGKLLKLTLLLESSTVHWVMNVSAVLNVYLINHELLIFTIFSVLLVLSFFHVQLSSPSLQVKSKDQVYSWYS